MALELKTTDTTGKELGSVPVDEAALGGFVKNRLIHAAAVMYHANLRQGTHCTKTRAEVAGSTKKLYKQKGTGRARAGNRKSGTRKGGGVIHGPKPRDYSYSMPRKQRNAALRSVLLGKAKDGELRLVEGLDFQAPKTKQMASMIDALKLDDTVLVVTDGLKRNVYLAGRNLPGISVMPSAELNARALLTHKFAVVDKAAFERLSAPRVKGTKHARKPKGTRKHADAASAGGEG